MHENSRLSLFKILPICFIVPTNQIMLLSLVAGFYLHHVCFTELLPRCHQSTFPGKPETLLSVVLSASVKSGCLVSDRKHGGIQSGAWETRSNRLEG